MEKTETGYTFNDANAHKCVLEESAGTEMIRLGLEEAQPVVGKPVGDWAGDTGLNRGTMSLSREAVAELLPRLIEFVETGKL